EPRGRIRHERPLQEAPSLGQATNLPVEQKTRPSRVANVHLLHGRTCRREPGRNSRFPNSQRAGRRDARTENSCSSRSLGEHFASRAIRRDGAPYILGSSLALPAKRNKLAS